MYGVNLAGRQKRAFFQVAGGAIMKFRHPYLAGALSSTVGNIDEVDISASVKLDETFFKATPNQDSSKQEVLVDGTTVVITNSMLNGTIELPLIRTSGIVAEGDAVACFQLIKSVGDNIGGALTVTEFINGKAITTLYYGISIKSVPDKILMGLNVPTYACQLFYAGWMQVVTDSPALNARAIWASGSANGVNGVFTPFAVNNASTENNPLTADNGQGGGSGQMPSAVDVTSGAIDNSTNMNSAIDGTYENVSSGTILN